MAAIIPDPNSAPRTPMQPSARVASYEPGAVDRAAEQVGGAISQMAEQEGNRIASTQAQDALNQLAKTRIDLTLGAPNADGTGGGFRNLIGGRALAKDSNGDSPLKTYPAQFNAAIDSIGSTLTGQAARMYSERAQAMGNQFQADVLSHVMAQSDAHSQSTLEDTVRTNQVSAALDPTNPVAVQTAIQNIKDAVTTYSLNPRAGDTGKYLAQALSGVHSNVVDQAIAQGNPQYALSYFNQNKGEMSPQDILSAEGKLTYSQRQNAAIGAVSGAVKTIGWQPGRQLPTEQSVVDASIANLGSNPDPRDREATIQEAQRQYQGMVQARMVAKENAITAAQQELIKGKGQVPLSAGMYQRLATYAPEYMAQVPSFMAAIDPSKETATNQAAYNAAVSNPGELAKMSDSEFLDFQTRNFAQKDRDKIANLRADALNGSSSNGPAHLDTTSLNSAVDGRLASIGINPRPAASDLKGQQRVDAVKHFITEDIYQSQAQLGRKMTGPEINTRVNQLFAGSIELPGLLYGTNTTPMLSMKAADIPRAERDQVVQSLNKVGVAAPTDEQILNTYWKWKRAQTKGGKGGLVAPLGIRG